MSHLLYEKIIYYPYKIFEPIFVVTKDEICYKNVLIHFSENNLRLLKYGLHKLKSNSTQWASTNDCVTALISFVKFQTYGIKNKYTISNNVDFRNIKEFELINNSIGTIGYTV